MKEVMLFIIKVLAAILLTIFLTILDAYVLKILWEWFIVPMGIKPLPVFNAIGISLIMSMLSYQYIPTSKDLIVERLLYVITLPLSALFIGLIIKSIM